MKELRLRGVSTIEAGNAFLPTFAADYDARFARSPVNPNDAHRPLRQGQNLDEVFRWKEQRKLTHNLTLHYRRALYLVEASEAARKAAGRMVDVHEREDGSVTQQDIDSNKYLGRVLEDIRDAAYPTLR